MKTFSAFQKSHKSPKLQVFKASVDLPKQSLVLLKFLLKLNPFFIFWFDIDQKGNLMGML